MLFSQQHSWTRRSVLQHATRVLEQGGIEGAQRNAEWLLMEVLSCTRASLYAFDDHGVPLDALVRLDTYVERRLQHEPLQYILGYTEFYGLRIQVTPAVLIPRPETEQVVEAALARLHDVPSPRVLDIGTGSGCIPLAIKHQRNDAQVYGCDISSDALTLAHSNAEALKLTISLFEADVQVPGFVHQAPSALDLVISNPPYVPNTEADSLASEVADHEPHLALFSGTDPLHFYRVIAPFGLQLLKPNGWLVFETHADYGDAVYTILQEAGYTAITLENDLAELPRIVCGQKPSP